jgi:uncharacterized 2Fe-2S/4Fe-4S cluster protein (DUF4445 family)
MPYGFALISVIHFLSMSDETGPGIAQITVNVEEHGTFRVAEGVNLREGLREQGLFIDGSCGDKGTCGRCVVRVLSGYPRATGGPPGPSESGILGPESIAAGDRLACRVIVYGDLSIDIDAERILEIDKTGRWKEVGGSPLAQFDSLYLDGTGYGIALDLGTTSMAAALYERDTGRLVDIRTAANPQLPWGEEIISRLENAARDQGAAQSMVNDFWKVVQDLVRSLLRRSVISSGRVSGIVAVANSAIHHLALGIDAAPLLTPPFNPSSLEPLSFDAGVAPFNLPAGSGATIDFLPLVGGFAGSDCLAAILAARHKGDSTGAVIDVGTNTEIAVWRDDQVVVATAPSGPAFEGGHIRCGMMAEEGAISSVELGERGVAFDVIGDEAPRGICGTGIIDTVAGMVSRQVVDSSGLVNKGSHPALDDGRMILYRPTGVLLEPVDIATIQKAKAAVAATLKTALNVAGMIAEDLQKVYLAGAFGSRLNVGNAVRIGLLPELPPERIEHDRYILAGNAAMAGAAMVLLSSEAEKMVEALARNITHLSVADDPDFQELFLENLYFS